MKKFKNDCEFRCVSKEVQTNVDTAFLTDGSLINGGATIVTYCNDLSELIYFASIKYRLEIHYTVRRAIKMAKLSVES